MEGLSKRIVNKIKSTGAFTLAEALVAVIILLLVTGIVAAGIPAAVRAYDKVVMTANSHVLLSTGLTTLRNELLTAKNVEINEEKTEVLYYNEGLGTESRIFSESESGKIMIQRYAASKVIKDAKDSVAEPLVSTEEIDKDKGLYITFSTVDYKKNDKGDRIITFENVEVKDNNGNTIYTSKDPDGFSYSIRVITSDGEVYRGKWVTDNGQ